MKMFKKSLAVLLAMVMLLCALPMVAVGAESYPTLELNTPTDVTIEGDDYVEYKFEPKSDGYYRFYSISDYDVYISVYDSEWDYVGYADDSYYDYNFDLNIFLSGGETYYLEMGNWEVFEVDFQVVAETGFGPISVEITQMPYDTTCVEGFEYETASFDGLEAEFTMSDGSVVYWSYEDDNMVGDFWVDVYIPYDFDNYDYYDFAVIECGNAYAEIPLTVVESPVDHIEYSSDTDIVYYENSCGFYYEYLGYYIYSSEVPDDAVVTIFYKDGTTDVVTAYDNDVIISDSQAFEPWGVGEENYIEISYLGASVEVPVTILPCPFESVTVNSVPTREYVFGDVYYGIVDEDGYYFYPGDLTGLSFTVEYADGTTQTYTDADIDMYNYTIDSYPFELGVCKATQVGAVEVTLSYKGADICYDVNVIESYIESIEVVKAPDKTEYEDRYYPDYTGMQIKLNYKDGTSAQATLNEDTTSYEAFFGYVFCEVEVGNDAVGIYSDYDYVTDSYYDYITCAGVSLEHYGINYVSSREIEEIGVENFSVNGDDMVVTVTYEDGTEDVLTYDVLDYYEQEDGYYEGYARTENGIVTFEIEEIDDGYYLYTLGEVVFIENAVNVPILGDVDGDGIVTVLDATDIQCYLAGLKTLNDQQLSVADTDADGIVTVLDATRIQKYKAHLIDEL